MGSFSAGQRFDGFKRLCPKLDAVEVPNPARTQLMAAMCNVLHYAWAAYDDPEADGLKEETLQGHCIRHLNYDILESAVDGVLKIYLKEAKNVEDADWGWWNLSDPYVVFSAGSSFVRSQVISDTENPVWNSTHYLPLRSRHVRSDFDGKLHLTLFDDDSQTGYLSSLANCFNQDDCLGTAQIKLEDLKKPGVQSFELQLKKETGSGNKATTLIFTTEFISFEQACVEQGLGRDSGTWLKDNARTDNPLTPLSKFKPIEQLGQLRFQPVAYVNVPSSDTQAWMYVAPEAKTLLIAYRGTETDRIKDVMLDLTAYQTAAGEMSEDRYPLKPTDALSHSDVKLHSGFSSAYYSIREAILQLAYDVTGWNSDWAICLTGHSLGGALATLCGFEFVNRKNPDGSAPDVSLMNVGAPRVGNRAFAALYNDTLVDSYRVVDAFDVVHLVPPFYVHTAKEVVCRSYGDVFIEGVLLRELDPSTLVVNTRELDVEIDDAGSLEEIVGKYGAELDDMAEKHQAPNYFSIVSKAVSSFFGINA